MGERVFIVFKYIKAENALHAIQLERYAQVDEVKLDTEAPILETNSTGFKYAEKKSSKKGSKESSKESKKGKKGC